MSPGRTRRLARVALALCLMLFVVGCAAERHAAQHESPRGTVPTPTPSPTPTPGIDLGY